jgi:hypothetical protein
MKLKEISEAREILSKLLTNPIEAKLAYRLNKITNKILSELKTIEKDRIELVEKYVVQDPDTTVDGKEIKGQRRIPEDKISDFMTEFDAYLENECNLEIEKIPYDILNTLKVTPVEMSILANFIEEPLEEPNVIRVDRDLTNHR